MPFNVSADWTKDSSLVALRAVLGLCGYKIVDLVLPIIFARPNSGEYDIQTDRKTACQIS